LDGALDAADKVEPCPLVRFGEGVVHEAVTPRGQGLSFVHFSLPPEPFLTLTPHNIYHNKWSRQAEK
jgi:hypothetical protein